MISGGNCLAYSTKRSRRRVEAADSRKFSRSSPSRVSASARRVATSAPTARSPCSKAEISESATPLDALMSPWLRLRCLRRRFRRWPKFLRHSSMDVLELDMDIVVALLVYQAKYPCLESGNGSDSKRLPRTIREKDYRKNRTELKQEIEYAQFNTLLLLVKLGRYQSGKGWYLGADNRGWLYRAGWQSFLICRRALQAFHHNSPRRLLSNTILQPCCLPCVARLKGLSLGGVEPDGCEGYSPAAGEYLSMDAHVACGWMVIERWIRQWQPAFAFR